MLVIEFKGRTHFFVCVVVISHVFSTMLVFEFMHADHTFLLGLSVFGLAWFTLIYAHACVRVDAVHIFLLGLLVFGLTWFTRVFTYAFVRVEAIHTFTAFIV